MDKDYLCANQQKAHVMASSDVNSSKRTYWMIFAVSLVIMLAFLVIDPTWFWVPLPFVLTYFVKAIDYM